MEENVLLLCLSRVTFRNGMTTYVYNDPVKGEVIVDGYMTNEAPAKTVLSIVEQLDRVVVICSDDVNKKLNESTVRNLGIAEDENWEWIANNINFPIENKEQFLKGIHLDYTHYEYYKNVISQYAKNNGKSIPQFLPVNISNNPDEYEIAKVATTAADLILDSKNNDDEKIVNLYIDYNGGQRYIASMLLNIANLMEQRGVRIKDILTMNYEHRDEMKRVRVENFIGVLQSTRLVSGIKEYVDYGRCRELKNYFKNCGDIEIENILNKMDTLSHDFQMCDTNKIFGSDSEIKNLKLQLEGYTQKNDNVFSILFKYVAEDILDGYHILFEGDLLDIIDWCCEKDYIQQAITFYAERMPNYFWDKGIYYPTNAEYNEYKQIKQACDKLNARAKILDDNSRKYLKSHYLRYDWKASWMEKYLQYSDDDELKWMDGNMSDGSMRYNTINYWENPLEYGRAQSDFIVKGDDNEDTQKRTLSLVLKNYHDIKKQRNLINHADTTDDVNDNTVRWDYNTLLKNLKDYIDRIRRFMND